MSRHPVTQNRKDTEVSQKVNLVRFHVEPNGKMEIVVEFDGSIAERKFAPQNKKEMSMLNAFISFVENQQEQLELHKQEILDAFEKSIRVEKAKKGECTCEGCKREKFAGACRHNRGRKNTATK